MFEINKEKIIFGKYQKISDHQYKLKELLCAVGVKLSFGIIYVALTNLF
jgi:hypothetical protein